MKHPVLLGMRTVIIRIIMTDSGEVDGGELVNIGTINVRTSDHILDCSVQIINLNTFV